MAWNRFGVLALVAFLAACSGGSDARPAAALAEAPYATRVHPTGAEAPVTLAILTDALLAPGEPVAAVPSAPVAAQVAPVSPEIAVVLEGRAGGQLDPANDLAISMGTTELDIFQSGLDVMGPLDGAIGSTPPASPAPDLR